MSVEVTMHVFLLLIATTVGLASAADDCFYTAVDLSYRLSPFSTNYYPNFLPFEITIELVNVITDILFNEAKYIAGDEGGTKVEVPGRFCDNGYKVGELCKDQLLFLPGKPFIYLILLTLFNRRFVIVE